MKYISPPIILFFIIVTGLVVRLIDLDGESIWVDEGHAIYVASFNLDRVIEESSRDTHPPLYSIILHYWMKLGPQTAYHLRLLSVIFGVLSIFLIYKVGKELFDQYSGMVGSLILALSVFHLHFSQEIRSYMLVVVLILLSYYLLLILIKKQKFFYYIFYIIIITLLVYTHFLGWFILLAQNIYYLLRFPLNVVRIKRLAMIDAIILILFLPWVNIMISMLFDLQVEFWILEPTILSIPQTFLIYAGTYTSFGIILLLLFCTLVIYGLFFLKEWKVKIRWSDRNQNYLLLIWMWIPILVPFFISFISAPLFITRITIGASLAFYLLAANGLKYIDKKAIKNSVLALIIILSLCNCVIYYNEINKERWKEVTEYVESNAHSGDLLIFHAGFGLDKAFNFYAKRDDLDKTPFPEIGLDINKDAIYELKALLKDKERVWLILSHGRDEDNLIIKNLKIDYDLIYHREYVSKGINSHYPYVGIELFQFQRMY